MAFLLWIFDFFGAFLNLEDFSKVNYINYREIICRNFHRQSWIIAGKSFTLQGLNDAENISQLNS
jgi:hypothetical protein